MGAGVPSGDLVEAVGLLLLPSVVGVDLRPGVAAGGVVLEVEDVPADVVVVLGGSVGVVGGASGEELSDKFVGEVAPGDERGEVPDDVLGAVLVEAGGERPGDAGGRFG